MFEVTSLPGSARIAADARPEPAPIATVIDASVDEEPSTKPFPDATPSA
jgi:hypothetical protein